MVSTVFIFKLDIIALSAVLVSAQMNFKCFVSLSTNIYGTICVTFRNSHILSLKLSVMMGMQIANRRG